MNSKLRLNSALTHTFADRLPIDYLAVQNVSHKLMTFLGIKTERELIDSLESDFYYLSFRDFSQNESCLPFYHGPKLIMSEKERLCPYGIRWRRGAFSSKFGVDETIEGPFEKETTIKDLLSHPWPSPSWFDLHPLLKECEEFADKNIIGGFWSAIFGDTYRIYGYEHFLVDMLLNPEIIKTLIDRITDLYLELNDKLFSILKDKMDIFFMGNDFGTQQGLIMQEDLWLQFFYQNYKKLIDHAHQYGYKVMVHSCGAIQQILPHLIRLGIDIIDPVQTTAVGMDPEFLRDNFSNDLVFHGGIDTQKVLPGCNPDEVYRHTVEMMKILGNNGGYIVASSNNINNDTPVANIMAMYRAATEYKPEKDTQS